MKHPKPILGLLILGLLSLGSAGLVMADDDDDDDDNKHRGRGHEERDWMDSERSLGPIVNATYTQECGSCHMAYQPGLLPPRAWAEIMAPSALKDHYGDDASLTEDLRAEISAFLGASTPDLGRQGYPQRDTGSLVGNALPRITESAGFRDEHDEIPARLVKDNPEVGSFSQCNTCHKGAAEGDYEERRIDIPGHGPWRD